MSGTDLRASVLGVCYAMSGTDLGAALLGLAPGPSLSLLPRRSSPSFPLSKKPTPQRAGGGGGGGGGGGHVTLGHVPRPLSLPGHSVTAAKAPSPHRPLSLPLQSPYMIPLAAPRRAKEREGGREGEREESVRRSGEGDEEAVE
eukprot:467539-Rhodomonas_salina.1